MTSTGRPPVAQAEDYSAAVYRRKCPSQINRDKKKAEEYRLNQEKKVWTVLHMTANFLNRSMLMFRQIQTSAADRYQLVPPVTTFTHNLKLFAGLLSFSSSSTSLYLGAHHRRVKDARVLKKKIAEARSDAADGICTGDMLPVLQRADQLAMGHHYRTAGRGSVQLVLSL
ncbi:uncharacterized protein LOC143284990 [Babylonia areolata]|uniref:uncharacterized protein LOC143284990 n=1 Tax=Babylonia areolata TaxID=304850 RepID=UPI003FD3ADC4